MARAEPADQHVVGLAGRGPRRVGALNGSTIATSEPNTTARTTPAATTPSTVPTAGEGRLAASATCPVTANRRPGLSPERAAATSSLPTEAEMSENGWKRSPQRSPLVHPG